MTDERNSSYDLPRRREDPLKVFHQQIKTDYKMEMVIFMQQHSPKFLIL